MSGMTHLKKDWLQLAMDKIVFTALGSIFMKQNGSENYESINMATI